MRAAPGDRREPGGRGRSPRRRASRRRSRATACTSRSTACSKPRRTCRAATPTPPATCSTRARRTIPRSRSRSVGRARARGCAAGHGRRRRRRVARSHADRLQRVVETAGTASNATRCAGATPAAPLARDQHADDRGSGRALSSVGHVLACAGHPMVLGAEVTALLAREADVARRSSRHLRPGRSRRRRAHAPGRASGDGTAGAGVAARNRPRGPARAAGVGPGCPPVHAVGDLGAGRIGHRARGRSAPRLGRRALDTRRARTRCSAASSAAPCAHRWRTCSGRPAATCPVLITGETGHGQGTRRPRAPPALPRGHRPVRARSTAPPSPATCWRASCSATGEARSRAPAPTSTAWSAKPWAARCSSTRSASWTSPSSRSCSAFSRPANCSASVKRGRCR